MKMLGFSFDKRGGFRMQVSFENLCMVFRRLDPLHVFLQNFAKTEAVEEDTCHCIEENHREKLFSLVSVVMIELILIEIFEWWDVGK